MLPAIGVAQTLPGFSSATPAPSSALYTTAPIILDGHSLFQVAEPVSAPAESIVARANDVSVALDQILATKTVDGTEQTAFDPSTLHVEIVRENDQVVLEAVDKNHRDGVTIVTVTSADASYEQLDASVVAEQWQAALQPALVRALEIRQPEQQRKNLTLVLEVLGGLLAITLLGSFGVRRLTGRIKSDDAAVKAHEADAEAQRRQQANAGDDTGASAEIRHARLAGAVQRRFGPAQRLSILRAVRVMTIALLALAWFGAIAWSALQFPATVAFGTALVHNVLAVAVIWIVTLLIDRSLTIVVERLPTLWELRALGGTSDRDRQVLRAPTIARALGGFKTVVLVFFALLATMTQVGIPVGSVVTIGGLAAIAVSLAAQNLIRDVVSGFLILLEDQFVVGDSVTINGMRGTVERLTLRMAQLRDMTGALITISNSAATSIINHSRDWSRVDYSVSVDATADLDAAIAIVREQVAALTAEPEWRDAASNAVEWIGVDAISRDGAVVTARLNGAPLRQFALRRELNVRISRAFATAKIGFGAPLPPVT